MSIHKKPSSETLTVIEVPFDKKALLAFSEVCRRADGYPPFSDYSLRRQPIVMQLIKTLHVIKTPHGISEDSRVKGNEASAGIILGCALINGDEVEMVIAPEHRNRGYGTYFFGALLDQLSGNVKFWAHGSSAGALAIARKYTGKEYKVEITRVVHIMQCKSLRELCGTEAHEDFISRLWSGIFRGEWKFMKKVDTARIEGRGPQDIGGSADNAGKLITYRYFRPGKNNAPETEDETKWLKLNAQLFKDHPEQGKTTLQDLRFCYSLPWFNRKHFILAMQSGEIVGYVWIKLNKRNGEVYALGSARKGLGSELLVRALRTMHKKGVRTAFLYVDAANKKAMDLYRKFGFVEAGKDTLLTMQR